MIIIFVFNNVNKNKYLNCKFEIYIYHLINDFYNFTDIVKWHHLLRWLNVVYKFINYYKFGNLKNFKNYEYINKSLHKIKIKLKNWLIYRDSF